VQLALQKNHIEQMGLLELFTKTVGVDPGSQNLRIVHDDEIIFNEPSELSFSSITNKVTGFGNKSIDSEPNIIIRPIQTVIADFHGFEFILRD
jgi:actin-like ATPase involved in cell morphogenesis